MSDDSKPRPPRYGLPPSGLADEILGALKRGEILLEGANEAAPGSAPEESAPTSSGVDRIYTFTDALQLGDEEEEEREVYETWVEFRIGSRRFALPVAQVREIVRADSPTPVPHPPYAVLGVFNLRGRVVPLLDLRSRLGLPRRAIDADSRIVVVESEARRIGILVDSVERVAPLAQSAIHPPDDGTQEEAVRGLHAAEGRTTRLLDLTTLLTLPERENTANGDGSSPPGG